MPNLPRLLHLPPAEQPLPTRHGPRLRRRLRWLWLRPSFTFAVAFDRLLTLSSRNISNGSFLLVTAKTPTASSSKQSTERRHVGVTSDTATAYQAREHSYLDVEGGTTGESTPQHTLSGHHECIYGGACRLTAENTTSTIRS